MRLSRDWSLLVIPPVFVAVGAFLLHSSPGGGPLRHDGESSTSRLSSSASLEPEQEGGLFFPETEVDLGVFKHTIAHDFLVENRGRSTVRFLHIKPSCNCTAIKPEKTILLPSETAKISVPVDGSHQRVGRQLFIVDVEYEEASSVRQKRLGVYAQYRPGVVVPALVEIRSPTGKIGVTSFSVVDYQEQPFQITSIQTSTPDLQVQVLERPTNFMPGWEHRLKATLAASDLALSEHMASITLRTTDPEHDPIKIPAQIRRVNRIRLMPEHLRLRADPERQDRQVGMVFLDDTEGDSIELKSVATPVKELAWRTVSTSTQNCQKIEFSLEEPTARRVDRPIRVRIVVEKPVREKLCVTIVPLHAASSSARP